VKPLDAADADAAECVAVISAIERNEKPLACEVLAVVEGDCPRCRQY
jgi:hypothetical protein